MRPRRRCTSTGLAAKREDVRDPVRDKVLEIEGPAERVRRHLRGPDGGAAKELLAALEG
jgi:hypothetical protein